ncbi:hypothetical protein ILYODFUR_010226 [Ilyodon furcidens]|uniref:Uncharacterized protein n=1 Tax=Ilyodon furcidens TaxID=33524 RepID=A0ABV0V2W9_9TELE
MSRALCLPWNLIKYHLTEACSPDPFKFTCFLPSGSQIQHGLFKGCFLPSHHKDTNAAACILNTNKDTSTNTHPSSSPPTHSSDHAIHFISDSLCGDDELET